MLKYILKRLLQSIFTLFIVVTLVFLLMKLMPALAPRNEKEGKEESFKKYNGKFHNYDKSKWVEVEPEHFVLCDCHSERSEES